MLPFDLDTLIARVTSNPKYTQVAPEVVARVAAQELPRHRKLDQAVKATRTRLHQASGAYLQPHLDYSRLGEELAATRMEDIETWCQTAMAQHASTAERLPFLENFFETCLAGVAPPHSILDLACGFNPFTFPWQPGFPNAGYYASDILDPMVELISQFLNKLANSGAAFTCDLATNTPHQAVDLVLMMKIVPLLDQVDRQIVPRLLAELNAPTILITFPGKSLGGRSKGMPRTYAERMVELAPPASFDVQSFTFPNELAYLLIRK